MLYLCYTCVVYVVYELEEKKMALKHIFQDTPTIKMLDFLIDHKGYDYSKTEIAENAGIGWTTLNRHWDSLKEWEFVIETRKIGRATLYKLNEKNPVVKKLLSFDKEAAVFMSEKIAEGKLSEAKKIAKNEEVEEAKVPV